MEMGRLTRDGTAEPVSRDQILRHERGQGKIYFPVQLTTRRTGKITRLIHNLVTICVTTHAYMLGLAIYATVVFSCKDNTLKVRINRST